MINSTGDRSPFDPRNSVSIAVSACDNRRARAAALYLEVPLGVRDRQNAKPVFGLRLQEARLAPFTLTGSRDFRSVLDVPLFQHNDDPLRDSGATMLLGAVFPQAEFGRVDPDEWPMA